MCRIWRTIVRHVCSCSPWKKMSFSHSQRPNKKSLRYVNLVLRSIQNFQFTAIKFFAQRLRRSNVLKVINDAMNSKGINLNTIGIPAIRHFLYKSKSNAQLLCSEITVPYNTPEEFNRLEALYYDIHHRIHSSNRPTKLIYQLHEKEIILAWVRIDKVTCVPSIFNRSLISTDYRGLRAVRRVWAYC